MEPMTQATGMASRGYRLTGRFLEACDCHAICPCWIDEVPDEDECTGLFVWDIVNGEALGHDVSGLRVASASFHAGKRRGSRQKVMLFVDDRASDEQSGALGNVFTGRSGGPLGELADMLGELVAQRSATIDITWDDDAATVSIDDAIRAGNTPKVGPSGRVTSLVDPAMAVTFGSPALVGLSTVFHIELAELSKTIDVKG